MHVQFKNPKLYLMVFADVAIFCLSFLLAFLIRFEFSLDYKTWSQLQFLLAIAIPVKLVVYFCLNLYRGIWRYTDIRDSWKLVQASAISSLILVAIVLMHNRFEGFSRSVFVLDSILTFMLTGGLRAFIRTFYRYRENLQTRSFLSFQQYRDRHRRLQNVLILGAGDAGEKMLREIIENPELAYNVVGFLDDDPVKFGRSVHGIPVLGRIDEINRCIRKYMVDQVFVAMPSASGEQMRRVLDICQDCSVPFKTLPGIGEIMNGRVQVNNLREVSYEDLLGREPVILDSASIEHYLSGRTVLVSGAGGSIGSELCRQIIRFAPGKLILLESSELNLHSIQMEMEHELGFASFLPVLGRIQDKDLMERLFRTYRPQIVFHAAAYKHVPILEMNPWMAVENNIQGTQILMDIACKYNTEKFVNVSTDKAVRPTNVMGASKRVTELLMYAYNNSQATKFMAVRFGNVVGSSGSVIPFFKRQIERGGPVTVTHPEMTRYFMTIHEAAQLILQSGALGQGEEIFVLNMGVPVKIDHMAKDLIKLMGKEVTKDIEIKYTGPRPGEKIFEELITDEEGIATTRHKDIMVLKRENTGKTRQPKIYKEWLFKELDKLRKAAAAHDQDLIKSSLKQIVPEYQPKSEQKEQPLEVSFDSEKIGSGSEASKVIEGYFKEEDK